LSRDDDSETLMATEQSRGAKAAPYISVLILAPVVALFAFSWTDRSTDLTPGHAEHVVTFAASAAGVAALLALFLLIWLKPPLRGPRLVSVPILAFVSAVLVGLLALNSADRILQLVDFSGNVTRGQRQFSIARAYVSHGKGVSYHLQLAEPFADLSLTHDDYTATFGASEEVRPIGYCLDALIEQKGDAMRIMYPSVHPIPPGRVRHCEAGRPTP
jgi:hypothetical protein